MKLFAFLTILFFSEMSYGQFSSGIHIDSLTNETAEQIICKDFTGDQLNDILINTFNFPLDSMKLFVNQGGNNFSLQALSGIGGFTDIKSFDAGDIDNNGEPDIILAYGDNTVIEWFENHNGVYTSHTVATNLDFTTKVMLHDFNNDSMLDLLSLQHVEVILNLAITPGVFGPRQVITDSTEFYAIDIADYNNDQIPDVSAASGGFEVFLNDGNGNFTFQSQAGLSITFGLQSADIDNDNDVDIVSYETVRGLMYYSNNGNGNFTFSDTAILSTDNFEIFTLADVDCDSTIDILTSLRQQGKIVYAANNGNGNFSLPQVIQHENGNLIDATALGDLDNDQKDDVIWSCNRLGFNRQLCVSSSVNDNIENSIAIYPNPSSQNFKVVNRSAHKLKIQLTDITGRIINSFWVSSAEEKLIQNENRSGIYFLSAYDPENGTKHIEKIIVQ